MGNTMLGQRYSTSPPKYNQNLTLLQGRVPAGYWQTKFFIQVRPILDHGGTVEKEMHFFPWDFYLFEVIFPSSYYWFTNDLKPMCFTDFGVNCLCNCSKSKGRITKGHNFKIVFYKVLKFLKVLRQILVSS